MCPALLAVRPGGGDGVASLPLAVPDTTDRWAFAPASGIRAGSVANIEGAETVQIGRTVGQQVLTALGLSTIIDA